MRPCGMIGSMTDRIDAVILAGGTAERLGGASKADLRLGGARLLDLVLGSIRALRGEREGHDVVVAPPSVRMPAGTLRTMEAPPGSGPLAGIGAGLALLPDDMVLPPEDGDLVLVCAVDSPGIRRWAPLLLNALVTDGAGGTGGTDGAVAMGGEPEPFRQYLQGAYRRRPLDEVLAAAGSLDNRSVRGVLKRLRLIDVPVDADLCRDLDTPEDLAWWRRHFT
ncbi:Molybdenum cofactor guanylyltransferase [Acidipropionibacterium virtanenii]|uniref:Molybdenum cofactor guanylyltransferase n=2 Tax=Acidipropionibacterium virtanenii TaxID=2057246 RepID=A0A344UY26_9ACTN|nr:Molybdenum cofactor guanylyltransferase [Acidipropionibacterium virtanenii]